MELERTLVCVLLMSVGCLVNAAPTATCVTVNTTMPNRLPLSAIPSHYDLSLSVPDPNSCSEDLPCGFSGSVEIKVSVPSPTSCITLHLGQYLSYSSGVFIADTGTQTVESHFYNKETQFLRLVFPSPISGSGSLSIEFTGEVNIQAPTGLFVVPNSLDESQLLGGRSDEFVLDKMRDYFNRPPKGQRRSNPQPFKKGELNAANEKMFATQFEPSNARNMFPSFDEPSLKATFRLTVYFPTLSTPLMALSNTPYVSSESTKNTTMVAFQETMNPLPTYLVALAVGRFSNTTASDKGVEYRVFTPVGYETYGEHALNISHSCVDLFSELWDFPYSKMNPKMDSLAVYGLDDAMENQGLLTYDPSFLLCEPSTCTEVELAFISLVCCHEITHQWFGDTVTMPWWNQEYLNEGFARYEQYVSVDHFYPNLDIWNNDLVGADGPVSFIEFSFQRALSLDFQGLGQPVVVVPETEQLVSTSVLYEKGASINHMLATHLGSETWNKALATEVNNHPFSNPNYMDLLATFDSVAPGTSKKFAPWLLTRGFPVTTLSYNVSTCVLTAIQAPVTSASGAATWWIPLYVGARSNKANLHFLMTIDDHTATYKIPCSQAGEDWNFQGNFNQSAFTVVSYSSANLVWLTGKKVSIQTPEAEKKLFVQESTILAQTSHQTIDYPLSVLKQLGPSLASDSYSVPAAGRMLTQVSASMFAMTMVLASALSAPTYATIQSEMSAFYGHVVTRTGIIGDSSLATLRAPAVLYSVVYGNTTVVADLKIIYEKNAASVVDIPSDIRPAAFWVSAPASLTALISDLSNTSLPSSVRDDLAFGVAGASSMDSAKAIHAIKSYAGNDDAQAITLLGNMYHYNADCREEAFSAIAASLSQCKGSAGCLQAATTVLMGVQHTEAQIAAAALLLQESGADETVVANLKQLGQLNILLVSKNSKIN